MSRGKQNEHARLEAVNTGTGTVLRVQGRLDAQGVAGLWDAALDAARKAGERLAAVDVSGVEHLDGAGLALLLELKHLRDPVVPVEGLGEQYAKLLGMAEAGCADTGCGVEARPQGLVSKIGRTAGGVLSGMGDTIAFVGQCAHVLAVSTFRPGTVRWKEVRVQMIKIGADSIPILLLIGFLMGLILSFQSAVSLERFGAVIFVPDMLGLVMFREMGALITCILLTSRSGSAFAAEIGTMKINEEVDALVTMGLSPMRFLITPKIMATVLVIPLMTMFFNFAALIGGAVVMLSMGFPLATFTGRVFSATTVVDFAGGMFKGVVFSLLVAGVGCMRGLNTKTGAGAVGESTTSAVVSGLILIAVADGIFAVAFYYLGI